MPQTLADGRQRIVRKDMSYEDKFMSCITAEPESGCWLWLASCDKGGYGLFHYEGSQQSSHRVSYKLFKGGEIDGLDVCHSCDTPSCVNPDHLWKGTHKQNMEDAASKNRMTGNRKTNFSGENNNGAKLTIDSVKDIRDRLSNGESQASISRLYGVTRGAVGHIARGTRWANIH